MATNNKLYDIIEYNDYETLNFELLNDPEFKKIKSSISLLQHSIKYRAKECFDILIENQTTCNIEDTGSSCLAVQYYVNAPYACNKYYIDKMIEKKFNFDIALKYACKNNELYTILFDRVNKDKINYTSNAIYCLINNKMDIFESIIKYLMENNRTEHINSIFTEIIYCDSMTGLDFLMKLNYNWKAQPFILYTLLKTKSENMFNYFYNLYKNLSKEELNNIPNIKNFKCLFVTNKHSSTYINNILTLDITYDNIAKDLLEKYMDDIKLYSRYNTPYFEMNGYSLMELLFTHNKILTNPLIYINNGSFDISISNAIVRHSNALYPLDKIKLFVKKFFDICRHNKYNYSNEQFEILKKHKIIII
jgi:hypothetical protein